MSGSVLRYRKSGIVLFCKLDRPLYLVQVERLNEHYVDLHTAAVRSMRQRTCLKATQAHGR